MTNSHCKDFFMPKIVNREQKRTEITNLCYDLIVQNGFCNITVSQVAKKANMAKGSIYKYFESKEDILFSIIKSVQEDYDMEVKKKLNSASSTKEKVLALFQLCIEEDEVNSSRRKIYKEFCSVCLSKSIKSMMDFQNEIKKKYIIWLKEILKEGIKSSELKSDSVKLADGLFAMAEGVLLLSSYEPSILTNHIDILFKMIKEERL